MKIRIEESRPGELVEKAEDVVRTLEKLSGRDLLIKAAPHEPKEPRFEHRALEQSVTRSRKAVTRIRRLMDAKISAVLG